MNLEELRAKRQKLDTHSDQVLDHMQLLIDESERVADVAHNARQINDDLDREFELQTGLDKTDISFLFFATALQCVRWMLLPSLDLDFQKTPHNERMTAKEGGEIEKEGQENYLQKNKGNVVQSVGGKYFTWEEIIRAPVPYDAMSGTQSIVIEGVSPLGKNLYGCNHHAATFGHDPLIGWIIGTLNIMARKITFTNCATYNVCLNEPMVFKDSGLKSTGQTVTGPSSLPEMLNICFESTKEDDKRVVAAVAKQGMHLASDRYTKMGLQIPGLSLISPAKAQELLKQGWNSEEAKKLMKLTGKNTAIVGTQAMCSVLINLIIRTIHLLIYDENLGIAKELYEVKTRKILLYSNTIASSSNVIYVALKKDISKLDVGGIAITLYRLITDTKFIRAVKEEFIQKRWHELIQGDETLYTQVFALEEP